MIVGCYTLHLYCRNMDMRPGTNDTCKMPGDYSLRVDNNPAMFTHPYNEAGAKKAARRAGWKFNRDGDVECPWCAGRK